MDKKKTGSKGGSGVPAKRRKSGTTTTKTKRRKSNRGNKALKTAEKFAPPLAGVAAFLGPYVKNSGGIGEVPTAIMNDIKNFNATDATNRLKDRNNQKEIAIPLVGGVAIGIISKEVLKGKSKTAGRIVGKTATAYGVGKLAKVVLDPPADQPVGGIAQLAPPSVTDIPVRSTSNPYESGGY